MRDKMARTKKLPDKPSKLIRVALSDLIAVEKMKKTYRIDMGDWHAGAFEDGDKCSVCFAGSVMARTLGVKPNEDAVPSASFFDADTCYKLDWLDSIRSHGGELDGFGYKSLKKRFRSTGVDVSFDHDPPIYHYDPKGFKASMRDLAKAFELLGL